jgi:hypothetical protein
VETIGDDEEEDNEQQQQYVAAAAPAEQIEHAAAPATLSGPSDAVHEHLTGAQVEVLYDFTPQDESELECRQGDVLDVLDWYEPSTASIRVCVAIPADCSLIIPGRRDVTRRRPDDEWVRARINGREGVVPASYVQAIETFQATEELPEEGGTYTAASHHSSIWRESVDLTSHSHSHAHHQRNTRLLHGNGAVRL